MMVGVVLSVHSVPAGAETAAGVPAGASVVEVLSALDLGEDGGTLDVDGTLLTYVAADHDAGTVTLAAPLTAALEEGAWLGVHPPAPETVAQVLTGDGEGEDDGEGGARVVDAVVPTGVDVALVEGPRGEGEQETVALADSGGVLTVSRVLDREAGVDAQFIKNLVVDQIDAGFLTAQWILTEDGSIIAGDPLGSRVEITREGIRLFALGFNGIPYEAVTMINGRVAFAVVDQTRGMLGGITSTGDVTGQQGAFAKGLSYRGAPVVGQLAGDAAPGYMDLLPRGVLPGGLRTDESTGTWKSSEVRSISVRVSLEAGRRYRVIGLYTGDTDIATGVTRVRLRRTTDGSYPTLSSPQFGTEPLLVGYSASVAVSGTAEGMITVNVPTEAVFMMSYQSLNGSQARRRWAQLYVEDVGPAGLELGGGEDETPKTLYTTTWRATDTRAYDRGGAQIFAKAGEIDLWFIGNVAESAGVLFGGAAHTVTASSEEGRTLPQALSGATIHSVRLQVTNAMWWNPDVTNVAVGTLGASTLPVSKVVEGFTIVRDVPEGSAVWVSLDPAWFTNGVNRGITLGDKDGILSGHQIGAGKFQGPSDPDAPLLEVTYSR